MRPAQASGASGEPGARTAAAFVRGHDATKRGGGGPGSRRRRRQRGPRPFRPRPPGRPRPGLGGVASAGARSPELARPARPAPATSRAPSLTERIFPPFLRPPSFEGGIEEDAEEKVLYGATFPAPAPPAQTPGGGTRAGAVAARRSRGGGRSRAREPTAWRGGRFLQSSGPELTLSPLELPGRCSPAKRRPSSRFEVSVKSA